MILFITRKYPPSVGGMQQLSYHLTQTVSRLVPARIIKWGGSQIWLPLFLPYALLRALYTLYTKPVSIIHLSDPVLAPLGLFLRIAGRCPVVANAHGLDIVYSNILYQTLFLWCARRLDGIICISEATRQQCLARGIAAERTVVIPVGVNVEQFRVVLSAKEQRDWLDRWGLGSRPRHLLLTVGRLVQRKGVRFFVSEVLPKLHQLRDDWAYLIVGDGPERKNIEEEVKRCGLSSRVRILGQVPQDELTAAYALTDLFVMPNIPVENDPEGFGIVTIEARAAGLRVAASALEGITDSFDLSADGILVQAGNCSAWLEAIQQMLKTELELDERLTRRQRVDARYGWQRIATQYLAAFERFRGAASLHQNRGTRKQ